MMDLRNIQTSWTYINWYNVGKQAKNLENLKRRKDDTEDIQKLNSKIL